MQRQGSSANIMNKTGTAPETFGKFDPRVYNKEGYNNAHNETLMGLNSISPKERSQTDYSEINSESSQMHDNHGQMKQGPTDLAVRASHNNPEKKLNTQQWYPKELEAYGFDPYQSYIGAGVPYDEDMSNGRQRYKSGHMMKDFENKPKPMTNPNIGGYFDQEASASTKLELEPTLSLAIHPDETQRKILMASRGKPGVYLSESRPDAYSKLKTIEEEKKKTGLNDPMDMKLTGQEMPPNTEKRYSEQLRYTQNDEKMTGPTNKDYTINPEHNPRNEDNDDKHNEALGNFLRNYTSTMKQDTRTYEAVGKFLTHFVNTMTKNEPGTKDEKQINCIQTNKGAGTTQKNLQQTKNIELRNPEIYIPPMPDPNEIRAKFLQNEEKEFGKLNDLVNRYEATYLARRNIYMMVLSIKKQAGDEQSYSTGIDHLKETNEELIRLYRRIQSLSTKLEKVQDDDYIEMPNFGTMDKVDMKALQALPKYDPEKKDITLHQFWMKITQFINITKTSEEATKYILIYLLEGPALDTFEMNKEKPIKEIIKQLKENFGGMPTKLEYEEQMLHFFRGPKESIKSAMNRFEYIVKKLYQNEKDTKQIVEMKCKETVKKIACQEAKERLDRAEMEAKANGTELTYEERLKIISMEEDIIEKRVSANPTANFMQMVRYDPGYYHPKKLHYQRMDVEDNYDCQDPQINQYVEYEGVHTQEEPFEQGSTIPNQNFENHMYSNQRPTSQMEVNTAENKDSNEEYNSSDDDDYETVSETSDDDFEETPVEAKINTLLKHINNEEMGEMREEEENYEDGIRQLVDKLPNGMNINALVVENKKEEEFIDMLKNVANEINQIFK